jgi:polyadenylate-binding protein 2
MAEETETFNVIDDSIDAQNESGDLSVDADEKALEEMRKQVQEMEEEARKLKEMQDQVESMSSAVSNENKEDIDARSVYIGNVDYSSTPEELQQHFQACGTINRVTILCDKHTGHPKGFAYIEFVDKEAVPRALELNESMFKNRALKVTQKRTNVPSFLLHRSRPRFRPRGFRGRGPPRGRRGFYHPYQ